MSATDEETQDVSKGLVPAGKHEVKILLEAGYFLLDLNRADDAMEVFVGCAALLPKSEVPQLGLGTCHLAAGDYPKALQSFRVARRLAPASGAPRAFAGEALLLMGKVDEAMKELKAAIDLDPDGDASRMAQALIEAKNSGALPPRAPKG